MTEEDHLKELVPVQATFMIDPGKFWVFDIALSEARTSIDLSLTRYMDKVAPKKRPDKIDGWIGGMPPVGYIVAVRNPDTYVWQRGEVESVMPARKNHEIGVFLIDHGTLITVRPTAVRQLPSEFLEDPHLITRLVLNDVVPITRKLTFEEGHMFRTVYTSNWDPSAYTFVAARLELAESFSMTRVKRNYSGSTVLGDLHLVLNGKICSLTDLLTTDQYAQINRGIFEDQIIPEMYMGPGSGPKKPLGCVSWISAPVRPLRPSFRMTPPPDECLVMDVPRRYCFVEETKRTYRGVDKYDGGEVPVDRPTQSSIPRRVVFLDKTPNPVTNYCAIQGSTESLSSSEAPGICSDGNGQTEEQKDKEQHEAAEADRKPVADKPMGKSVFEYLMDAAMKIKSKQEGVNTDTVQPRWSRLPTHCTSKVYFDSATSPDQLYVRLVSSNSALTELQRDIQEYAAECSQSGGKSRQLGAYCLARFPDDGLWYRVKVLGNVAAETTDVFFVDHGETAKVSTVADLLPMRKDHVTRLPFQAIECRLVGIQPYSGEGWKDEVVDMIYNLTVDFNEATVAQDVHVFGNEVAENTGDRKYKIVISYTLPGFTHVSIVNKILVETKLVTPILGELAYLNI